MGGFSQPDEVETNLKLTASRTKALILGGAEELSREALNRRDLRRAIIQGIQSSDAASSPCNYSEAPILNRLNQQSSLSVEQSTTPALHSASLTTGADDGRAVDNDGLAVPFRLNAHVGSGSCRYTTPTGEVMAAGPADNTARLDETKAKLRRRGDATQEVGSKSAYASLKSKTQQKREAAEARDRGARIIMRMYRGMLRKRKARLWRDQEHTRRAEASAVLQARFRLKRIKAYVGYKGETQKGQAHGHGRMVWPDGAIYEGQWREGVPNGSGEVTWADGSYYAGEWAEGGRHGEGLHEMKDGEVYEGEWSHDLPNGRGARTAPNGSSKQGTWVRGKLTGPAVLTERSADGESNPSHPNAPHPI